MEESKRQIKFTIEVGFKAFFQYYQLSFAAGKLIYSCLHLFRSRAQARQILSHQLLHLKLASFNLITSGLILYYC